MGKRAKRPLARDRADRNRLCDVLLLVRRWSVAHFVHHVPFDFPITQINVGRVCGIADPHINNQHSE